MDGRDMRQPRACAGDPEDLPFHEDSRRERSLLLHKEAAIRGRDSQDEETFGEDEAVAAEGSDQAADAKAGVQASMFAGGTRQQSMSNPMSTFASASAVDDRPARIRRDSYRYPSQAITLEDEDEADTVHWQWRRILLHFLESTYVDGVIAGVILFNFVLICLETNSRVGTPSDDDSEPNLPTWVRRGLDVCFSFYIIEIITKMVAEQKKYWHSNWNLFDLFIISFGIFEYIVEIQALHLSGMGAIRIIHLCRLLRLLRVLRLFSVLKELRKLMQMFAGCFRTLGWSFCLLILIMTIWACVAVELLHPVVVEIGDHPSWVDNYRAKRAFASVWDANLTFFQTIVAGDSWGYIAIPVIEQEPWTCMIFAGALMTMVFGVLNLIVAVIVDTAADNRAKDFMNRALDLADEEREEKMVLSRIFQQIDEDGSGNLTWEELLEGSQKVEEFRHWLRAMDIDSNDLQQLFSIVDEDGSGTIDPDEFIEAMYRLKNADSRTTTKLIKHLVTRLHKEQRDVKMDLDFVRHRLEQTSSQEVAAKSWIREAQEDFRTRLLDQERLVERCIAQALAKAMAVALETAAHAAEKDTQSAMMALSALATRRASIQPPSMPPIPRPWARSPIASPNGSRSMSPGGTQDVARVLSQRAARQRALRNHRGDEAAEVSRASAGVVEIPSVARNDSTMSAGEFEQLGVGAQTTAPGLSVCKV